MIYDEWRNEKGQPLDLDGGEGFFAEEFEEMLRKALARGNRGFLFRLDRALTLHIPRNFSWRGRISGVAQTSRSVPAYMGTDQGGSQKALTGLTRRGHVEKAPGKRTLFVSYFLKIFRAVFSGEICQQITPFGNHRRSCFFRKHDENNLSESSHKSPNRSRIIASPP